MCSSDLALPGYARGLFWDSVDRTLAGYADDKGRVPWKKVRAKAEEGLVKEGHKGFSKAADELETGAMATLYAFLLVMLLAHGASLSVPLLLSSRKGTTGGSSGGASGGVSGRGVGEGPGIRVQK